jgi:hypothetical protein
MRIRSLLLFVLFAALAGGLFGQTPVSPSDTQKGYLVGPGDELTGKVLGEPQFDFVATVDVDGRIEVPFVEKPIMAKCKSERDLTPRDNRTSEGNTSGRRKSVFVLRNATVGLRKHLWRGPDPGKVRPDPSGLSP